MSVLAMLGLKPRAAVLGARDTGKSTLIGHLRVKGVRPRLKLIDVSGARSAKNTWLTQVAKSKRVVYLVDSRALCGCLEWMPDRNMERLLEDAAQLGPWLRQGPPRRIVIAVTRDDQDCRIELMRDEEGLALSTDDLMERRREQLAPFTDQLGLRHDIRIVGGNLGSDDAAAELVTAITAALK